MSLLPLLILFAQRIILLITGLVSHFIWLTEGVHHSKLGSLSVQINETSLGTLRPIEDKCWSAAVYMNASSAIIAVGGVILKSEFRILLYPSLVSSHSGKLNSLVLIPDFSSSANIADTTGVGSGERRCLRQSSEIR